MMTLARVVAEHPHAVQRELLCHRYRYADFGAPTADLLGLGEFVSFVIGAPPASALGLAVSEGWSSTDHLLANLAEQHAGLIRLEGRYQRPGVKAIDDEPAPERKATAGEVSAAVTAGGRFDLMNVADFEAKRRQHFPRATDKETA